MSAVHYQGWVRHRRFGDVEHGFRYPLTMTYVDATEVPAHGLPREDLLGDPAVPVGKAVRDLVEKQTGTRPDGSVRVLAVPRSLGVGFNPVRFYYAWHSGALHSVVAEVTNTPWGERHAYVLDPAGGRLAKEMHVSPLQPMDQEYAFRLTEPGERLVVHLENHQDGRRVFDATLRLERTERAPRPAQAARNLARIYAQSARLKLKGARYHPHPEDGPVNRTLMLRLLGRTRGGRLVLVDRGERIELGEPSGISVEVRVHDRRAYGMVLRTGSTGMADSYAAGMWECDDLVGLVRLAARNMAPLDALRRRFAPVLIPFQRIGALVRRSTPARARRDVAAHYDLSNELFALFLDETMMYSCALFERPDMTLREAQEAKLDRICRKLGLNPGDHVLEIGTGWGGFAIHAATHYGCRVTTTTISEAQRAEAQARVDAAGLGDLITILDRDYRELPSPPAGWRKMVSIEMIEAVGWRNLPVYLRKCGELLADDGLFCLQAITIDDRAYEVEKGTRSFANTRIFPGGFVPAQTPLLRATARHTSLRAVHLEEIGPHYATTLRRWAERFGAVPLAELERMGFDERFQRMWRFYLAYMEAGFAERRIGDVHLMLAGPAFRGEQSLLARLSAPVEAPGDEVEQQARPA